MEFYYGAIDGKFWGFLEEGDPGVTPDMVKLSEEEYNELFVAPFKNEQIVFYEGKVFRAEVGRYYVDENNTWKKRTDKEFEEYKKAQEKEYINSLSMTKRVFALMLQEYGISYSQLKEVIASNEQAQLEWDLCESLQRSNPLLDVMAAKVGILPEQLDEMFIRARGVANV